MPSEAKKAPGTKPPYRQPDFRSTSAASNPRSAIVRCPARFVWWRGEELACEPLLTRRVIRGRETFRVTSSIRIIRQSRCPREERARKVLAAGTTMILFEFLGDFSRRDRARRHLRDRLSGRTLVERARTNRADH